MAKKMIIKSGSSLRILELEHLKWIVSLYIGQLNFFILFFKYSFKDLFYVFFLDNLDLVFNCKCSFNRLGVSHTSVVGITLFTISDNKNRFMLYRID